MGCLNDVAWDSHGILVLNPRKSPSQLVLKIYLMLRIGQKALLLEKELQGDTRQDSDYKTKKQSVIHI